MSAIRLNDILQLDNLQNVKVRFNLMFANNWNPIEIFKNNQVETLLEGHIGTITRINHTRKGKSRLALFGLRTMKIIGCYFISAK